ncbi:MAG: hypothetical protein BWY47_01928 [Bacteroidetes bacterium ADurb.Bin302]|jgi:hypothetical protein|nr:MAG: hypothetical protein BWY47_01928 [Bacteroidetes bacterium ADurb.Bin302]
MYVVINNDNIRKEFHSDEAFLEYVQQIYKENEEDNIYPSEIFWMPENVQQAKEYIHEYCDNLTLTEE